MASRRSTPEFPYASACEQLSVRREGAQEQSHNQRRYWATSGPGLLQGMLVVSTALAGVSRRQADGGPQMFHLTQHVDSSV